MTTTKKAVFIENLFNGGRGEGGGWAGELTFGGRELF